MKFDVYTKVFLTVIAAALVALAIQPYTLPPPARAQGDIVDVRIADIAGRFLHWGSLNVRCN